MKLFEIKELLAYLENEIPKYNYDIDKNFIMNTRRKYLKLRIEENLLKNEGNNNELILEALFNFWEFINDDYFGDYSSSSRELGLSIQELIKKDNEYRKKGIICIQEKEVILEIIREIKKHINDKNI